MKTLLTSIAFIGVLTTSCTAQSDAAVTRKRYPIKSCRIVFRFFNGPQSGTKTVIFDDWGNKEKEEAVTITDTVGMRNAFAGVADSLRNRGVIGSSAEAWKKVLNKWGFHSFAPTPSLGNPVSFGNGLAPSICELTFW